MIIKPSEPREMWRAHWLRLWALAVVIQMLVAMPASAQSQPAKDAKRLETASAPSSVQAWKHVSDDKAWQLLPEIASGQKGRLPNWVKPVALQMPRTAAALLELDHAQRTRGPLDAALKAKLRWIIANANRCDYTKAIALGDLKLAQSTKAGPLEVEQTLGSPAHWPAQDADAYRFVKMLSTEAPNIEDSLFESLRKQFGDEGVAAIVLLTAYGNFQDRLLLGLQVPLEEDGPLPPVDVRFAEKSLQRAAILPPENGKDIIQNDGQAVTELDKQWISVSYAELQARLEKQRDRQPRLPVPDWEQVKQKLPPEMTARPTSIRWSLVTYGYAPQLAVPWTTMTRTHWAELPSERILEESLFWVQTRAVNCNYCMGHCEMLLEVAGLDKPAVANRTKLLAESDWSAFPKREQIAYAYARKLSATPAKLTEQDYQQLENEFGPKQAMSIYIWLCRGLYMTRISDGFQLPLERDNVFGGHAPTESKK